MEKGNLLFYDIEVFEKDALVVFMDIDGNEVAHFWNNRNRRYVEDPSGFEGVSKLIKGKVLAGYNNYSYDDHILTAMMDPARSMPSILKAVNNSIIGSLKYDFAVSPNITSIDTMQQIDVSHPSLKQIEGNMGLSIIESSVPFDIQRALTDEERQETLEYCRNDVKATIEVFKQREKSYFDVKKGLLDMLPESSENAMRWNTTTLSANVLLGGESLKEWQKNRVPDEFWRNTQGIPTEVWDMWENCMTKEGVMSKGTSKTVKAYGCNFVFGMGGLHGAPSKPGRYYRVKHKDVASMYPSSIVHLRALGDATDKYDEMRRERVSIKHIDPVKAGALKLILNSVYGNFKNKYSTLFNPLASATVCVYGQIALFSLCRDLYSAGYEIINANTDGVVYKENPSLGDVDEAICSNWEKTFEGYKLETDYYTEWIQRDVNNYIAVEEDGSVTVKGGDVNKYQTNKFFSNNSNRITQIAMVEYLVHRTPILDTFDKYMDDPLVWQFILKAGNTYKGVQDKTGAWQNKVNRVFACNDTAPYTKLFKVRQDDGLVNFPDVPELMFIWNDDVRKLTNFREIIDREYYRDLVEEKLRGWPRYVY